LFRMAPPPFRRHPTSAVLPQGSLGSQANPYYAGSTTSNIDKQMVPGVHCGRVSSSLPQLFQFRCVAGPSGRHIYPSPRALLYGACIKIIFPCMIKQGPRLNCHSAISPLIQHPSQPSTDMLPSVQIIARGHCVLYLAACLLSTTTRSLSLHLSLPWITPRQLNTRPIHIKLSFCNLEFFISTVQGQARLSRASPNAARKRRPRDVRHI
jgi:hypothetical protein